jgi:putative transposase
MYLDDRQKAALVAQHEDGVPWTRLAEHAGVSVRTVQRWAARASAGRLPRPPRSDQGVLRTPAELVKAIQLLAGGPGHLC